MSAGHARTHDSYATGATKTIHPTGWLFNAHTPPLPPNPSTNPNPTARNVLLIIGPPGSGKTTYAANSGLEHLEREQYQSDQAYQADVRLKCSQPEAQLAIVRCCPTIEEQREWETLTQSTRTIVLDLDPDECARRIHQRKRDKWRGEVAAARTWRTTRNVHRVSSRQW